MADEDTSIRGWVASQGEDALGKIAQEVLNHPATHHTLSAAFGARERVSRAQEVAMSALNLPSAGDLERLTRRIRSVSQRVEGIEDGLDRLIERLDDGGNDAAVAARLDAIEQSLRELRAALVVPAAATPALESTTAAESVADGEARAETGSDSTAGD